MSKEQFISDVAKYVIKYAASYGIKVHSPIIAQAILESNWGNSKLTAKYHNYFGIKCGSKWTGKSVNLTTQEEYSPGTKTTIKDNFRVYSSMEDGIKGYFEFIQLERYQNLKGITDPKKYLETIRADGYATSSTYVKDTYALVTQYNLTKYDKEKEVITISDVDKLISVAKAEVGYLEKRSNYNLDSKTGNAGYDNYQKYSRDNEKIGVSGYQGQAWCDTFVDWCFIKAFGKTKAKALLGGFSAYTPSSAQYFVKMGRYYKANPKVGDVIFFHNDSRICHTGIVWRVDNSAKRVYTIEGNTSNGTAVISNGGGVCSKDYAFSNSRIDGYGRPNYSGTECPPITAPSGSALNKTTKWTGKVTAAELNVRSYAGKENSMCSFSPLKKGTKVAVCDSVKASDGVKWHYIKYNSKYGFVSSKYIEKV